jgi:hypothetical protein
MGSRTETRIFDPKDSPGGTELLDASAAYRDGQWWMYLAGQAGGYGATQLFSASLAPGSTLSAPGWRLTLDDAGQPVPLCGNQKSLAWDGGGGRHCPSYVKGWDPHKKTWVERLYYAGATENLWGPYTIGYLEWDGTSWQDQPLPSFVANEDWEHGSVYEPNLIYHDGKWKMWYVAGSNQENYLIHGYAESQDGQSGWSRHVIFAPPEIKLFDFCVRGRGGPFEAVFARVSVGTDPALPETGLWWCCADRPYSTLSEWSSATQIMDARDCGWHSGAWKPSLHFHESIPDRLIIFFDGLYRTDEPGPFPFAFTLGCLECDSPRCTFETTSE